MASNKEHVIMNGHNYATCVPDMETLLKIKGLWKYNNVAISYLTNDQAKFFIDKNKDEAIGVIMTYISREIRFHIKGINFPHVVWGKLKLLFNKVN